MTSATVIWTVFAVVARQERIWLAEHPALGLAGALVLLAVFFLVQLRVALTPEHRAIIGNLFSGRERKILQVLGIA